MSAYPKTQISRLRDIAFRNWDPIGVLPEGASWENRPDADEYDGYLVEAVSRLANEGGEADATDYLMWVESEHMGMDTTAATRERAAATVSAIKDYIDSLKGGV